MSHNVPDLDTRKTMPLSRSLMALSLLTLSLLALSGCGQKGPLYMPGDSDASKTYDPQGVYDDDTQQPASVKQTPGQGSTDAQRQEPAAPQSSPASPESSPAASQSSPTSPQSSPAPAATQPNAEELP